MRNLLARLFGTKGRHEADVAIRDEALLLAHDWVLARGGQLIARSADFFEGLLPDGTSAGYTCTPNRLRQQPDLTLLMPNTPGFSTLQQDIAEQAASLVLRLTTAPATAITLARSAFASPHGTCRMCVSSAQLSNEHEPASEICAECPLRQGRLVLAGADVVRDVRIESERARVALEYTFRVSVASACGRRDELIRVAIDGDTGERLAPVDETLFHDAQSEHVMDKSHDPREFIDQAEALLQPAVQAVGRLAHAQALQNYQRQQDDLTATFERLLIEVPEAGQRVLNAREQALERLAETHAIEVDTRLVAAVSIQTPVVETHVQWRDGASLRAVVDPCRKTVVPLCTACEAVWRVGVRCTEGHITCLSCQQQCVHCGRRRCSLCVSPDFAPCVMCGGYICSTCARATARGRHQIHFPAPAVAANPEIEAASRTVSADSLIDERVGSTANDLCMDDLDAMSPTTWRACVTWLLAEMGYTVERELDQGSSELTFVCQVHNPAGSGGYDRRPDNAAEGSRRVAIGHRPTRDADTNLTSEMLARMRKLADLIPGTRPLLITTARDSSRKSDGENTPAGIAMIDVFDRSRLASWLGKHPTALRRVRERAAGAVDERAAAAVRLRTVVVDALPNIAIQISLAREDLPGGETPERSEQSEQSEGAGTLDNQITVARQALLALESLIEQWEATFTSRATREGAQDLTASTGDFEELSLRAEHLVAVLEAASGAITLTAAGTSSPDRQAWLEAVFDELVATCQSLATRCKALDPLAWRSFDAVRDPELARESVEHLATARRAAARARKLHDEIAAGRQNRSMRSRAV